MELPQTTSPFGIQDPSRFVTVSRDQKKKGGDERKSLYENGVRLAGFAQEKGGWHRGKRINILTWG